jgi:hypothetical protein
MAQSLRDSDDGWSILYIVCHLHDYEQIYTERARLMLELSNPTFIAVPSNDELSERHQYQNQNMREMLEDYLSRRQTFIKLLESLTDEQWVRQGIHLQTGEATVLSLAINAALHDIDHLGQIVQAIGDNV